VKIAVIAGLAQSLVNFRGPLLATLAAAGHEVVAYAPGHDAAVNDWLAKVGVRYHSIPLARASMNPVRDVALLFYLTRTLRRLRADLVLGYTVKPVIFGSLAAYLAGVPFRFSIITGLGYAFTPAPHASLARTLVNGLLLALYRMSLATNRIVFFQNPDDQALFIRYRLVTPQQSVLIHGSGVDLDHFRESAPVGNPVFLLIARLLKDKGIREYVDAARRVRARHPEARFQLLGPYDPNPSAIRPEEVDAWRHEGAIEYLGETDDVRPFLRACSVYVLPSYYREGTPRTVLEALATGRPVITTDAPGCRETVVHGWNGFLVPPRDAQSLAKTMEIFIDKPEIIRVMAKRSRSVAVQKYDVHKVNVVILNAMGLGSGAAIVEREQP
jgi:glycosyltransferase involved in cell wall biosynthesis